MHRMQHLPIHEILVSVHVLLLEIVDSHLIPPQKAFCQGLGSGRLQVLLHQEDGIVANLTWRIIHSLQSHIGLFDTLLGGSLLSKDSILL